MELALGRDPFHPLQPPLLDRHICEVDEWVSRVSLSRYNDHVNSLIEWNGMSRPTRERNFQVWASMMNVVHAVARVDISSFMHMSKRYRALIRAFLRNIGF